MISFEGPSFWQNLLSVQPRRLAPKKIKMHRSYMNLTIQPGIMYKHLMYLTSRTSVVPTLWVENALGLPLLVLQHITPCYVG